MLANPKVAPDTQTASMPACYATRVPTCGTPLNDWNPPRYSSCTKAHRAQFASVWKSTRFLRLTAFARRHERQKLDSPRAILRELQVGRYQRHATCKTFRGCTVTMTQRKSTRPSPRLVLHDVQFEVTRQANGRDKLCAYVQCERRKCKQNIDVCRGCERLARIESHEAGYVVLCHAEDETFERDED